MNVEENKIKTRKHLKLMQAHQNNITISDMNLLDKFKSFEDSKLNESKTLLYEIARKKKTYKRYARGAIVRVKFGVNVGSEFSGDHFAIVISKGDTMMSSTLHVIPLTSKKHLKNINIGNILYSETEINKLKELLKETTDKKKKKEISSCIKFYEKRKNTITYACIDHLKTISKLSICKYINEYDYLSNIRIPSEILKQIDRAIINEYTIYR